MDLLCGRMLLYLSAEGFSSLRGQSNASKLPCMLWGEYLPFKIVTKIGFPKVTIFTTLETALINHSLINVRFCHSIYSSRRKLSACFIVDTRFICNACTRWELTSSKPPMFTPDRYLADAFPDRGHSQLIRCQPADFFRFSCPVCLRSSCDMSGMWQKLDQEVQLPPLPIKVFVLY